MGLLCSKQIEEPDLTKITVQSKCCNRKNNSRITILLAANDFERLEHLIKNNIPLKKI